MDYGSVYLNISKSSNQNIFILQLFLIITSFLTSMCYKTAYLMKLYIPVLHANNLHSTRVRVFDLIINRK